MKQTRHTHSLQESDYLAILGVVTNIHQCRTRQELKNCIEVNFLSLFEAQSAAWGWGDFDLPGASFANSKIFDAVGIPEKQFQHMAECVPYQKSITQKLMTSSRWVIATDVDIPGADNLNDVERFFKDHPEYNREESLLPRMEKILASLDPPDFQSAIGIHRWSGNGKSYTLRDVRMLELIRPHLWQRMNAVMLHESLAHHRGLAEELADIPTAVALVNTLFRIIFVNQAFQELLPMEVGQQLPEEMADLIGKETIKFSPPYRLDSSAIELPFYRIPEGVFRLNLTLLNRDGEEENKGWLLRLKPAIEPFTKMNLLMQEGGLTAREMEIASLIRDGMDDKEIGGRLFISIHTVKNHVKNIHQKLDVHTRAKLVALLNGNDNTNG